MNGYSDPEDGQYDPGFIEHTKVLENFIFMTNKMKEKNHQLQILNAKMENLDVYHQHLTSVNVRCDLLDEQVKILENHPIDQIGNPINNEFRDIDWIATKATLENLRTEFKYLSNRFIETTSHDYMNGINESCNKTNSSLFSSDGTQFTDDTTIDGARSLLPDLLNVKPKKKVLKKESFLNISDQPLNANPNQAKHDFMVLPIKKFKICNSKSTPTTKTSIPDIKKESQKQLKGILKQKFDSMDMPMIEEEERTPISKHKTQNHQRRCSLPETISLACTDTSELTSNYDNTLKHFISYDVDLHIGVGSDRSSIFERPKYLTSKKHSAITKMISSSPLERFNYSDDLDITFTLDDQIVNDQDELIHGNNELVENLSDDETFSEDSYGEDECQPFILKKNSQLYLRKSKSHESIFKELSKPHSTRIKPNIELKEQTMKWLKPNVPSTSSQTHTVSNVTKTTINAHHNIVNMLNSSGLSSITESPAKSSNEMKDQSSWAAFLTTPTKPKSIPISTTVEFKHVEEQSGSWITSLVPNSAFATPETGKRMSTPSGRSFNPKGNLDKRLSVSNEKTKSFKSPSYHKRTIPQKNISSSLRSEIIIERNGVIKHGNGDMNNSVVMSRVSHSALRDALQFDIKS